MTNKIIYLVSYEDWGAMLMSKQHYALELGARNNTVYFINRPDRKQKLKRGEIQIRSTGYRNVYSVQHRLWHPYFLKFKYKYLYNLLTWMHIRRIERKIKFLPDIVWSFDAGNNLPLSSFCKKAFHIYMPVDGPFNHQFELEAAKSADLIISVTIKILERYKEVPVRKFLINHGVANVFFSDNESYPNRDRISVGYSGSLIRNDLDIAGFKKIISDHPDKLFEFWGEINPETSNIHLPQDVSFSTKAFLEFLQNSPNVQLHGPVNPEELAAGLRRMDALLIIYNIPNDPNNHHKVLEYLASGKVIISTYMEPYSGKPDIVQMVDKNEEIACLFDSVMQNITQHNSTRAQLKRKNFASQFTYSKQIEIISSLISPCKEQEAPT